MNTATGNLPLRRPPWGWLIVGIGAWIAAYANLLPFADAVVAASGLAPQTHLGCSHPFLCI